ncbi:MAG: PQQ-binding-like beta-propeller repeat protein [Planctomycetota bacterium]
MRRPLSLLLLLLMPLSSARSGEGDVLLLTDEAIPRYLQRGQQLARSGEWAKMIDILQRVIVGDAEIFPELDKATLHSAVHTNDGVLYYPARELCVQELSRLPEEGLAVYRATYDVPAAELLTAARAAPNLDERLAGLTTVFDLYLISSSGDDALEEAADLHLQLGRYFESLALLRRLLDVYPGDSDRDLAMARTKAAYCAARIGDRETRRDMLERLVAEFPGRRVLVEGKRVAVEDLADHPVMALVGAIDLGSDEDWPTVGGDSTRARTAEDLPEDLTRKPFWRFELQARDPQFVAPSGRWVSRMPDRERPIAPTRRDQLDDVVALYPTVRPIVHDGILFYKDYIELAARRIGSGELVQLATRTRYPRKGRTPDLASRKSLPVAEVRPETGPGNDGPSKGDPTTHARFEAIYRWYDYGGNEVVVSNEHLITAQARNAPRHLKDASPRLRRAPPNVLHVFERDWARTVWGWDPENSMIAQSIERDPERRAAWKKDAGMHRMTHFRGPGVVAGGVLYTVAETREGTEDRPGGVSLWAFRMRDGGVLFRTELHNHDTARGTLPAGASIAAAGSVIYTLTHAGVLCAVDALPPGRIRWIRRYPRSFPRQARGISPTVQMLFAYNEPVVAGGKVLVMAPDSTEVQALDAETGRLVWSLDTRKLKEDVRHIVGVSGSTLVLAGYGVVAIDINRGKVVWSHEHLEIGEAVAARPTPYGRGYVSERVAYVPSASHPSHMAGDRSYIHCYDISSGKRLETVVLDVPRLGNIVCIGGRLIATNESEVMCFTTADREIARLDARLQREEGPRSGRLLERALVRRRANPEAMEPILEDLRAAVRAVGDENSDDREPSWRLIHQLIEKARRTNDVAPLEEAREVAEALDARQRLRTPNRAYHALILLEAAAIEVDAESPQKAYDHLQTLVRDFSQESVPVGGRVLPVPVAAREMRERLMGDEKFRAIFLQRVRARIDAAREARDKEALVALAKAYGNQPPAEEAWFALARLHTEDKRPAEAALALRIILREFPAHPRRVEAHLRLAIALAKQQLLIDARTERDEAIARIDTKGRETYAALIAELAELIPEFEARLPRPTLTLPLRPRPLPDAGAQPIAIEGKVPEAFAKKMIVASGAEYVALDEQSRILWRIPNPAGAAVDPGPPAAAETLAVATALAHARFARFLDGDLLLGDAAGVTRVNLATGDVLWSWPESKATAAEQATRAVESLRRDLRELQRRGHHHRRSSLPAYALRRDALLVVHPELGVLSLSLNGGNTLWSDEKATGARVGEPAVVGQLMAVGRAEPGAVDLFDLGAGRRIQRLDVGKVLLAAPHLDRLGRLYLIDAENVQGRNGAFRVRSARDGATLLARPVPVHSRYATILHVDTTVALFHDGSSGGDNLHFLELGSGKHVRLAGEDVAREVHVVRDGRQLFVLTHKLGVADEGARVFRIDIGGRSTLRYERPEPALAYARPLLTQRFFAVAHAGAENAGIRLYEREAAKDLAPPAPVFPVLGGRAMNRSFASEPDDDVPIRFDVAPALAAPGGALVAGLPFGGFRFDTPASR